MSSPTKSRHVEPGVVTHCIRVQGATSSIVKELGVGVTVARNGTGSYRIVWNENPGTFVGWSYSLEAVSLAGVSGHMVAAQPYETTSARRLDFAFYDPAQAAHDLQANEFINIWVKFKTTSVPGA